MNLGVRGLENDPVAQRVIGAVGFGLGSLKLSSRPNQMLLDAMAMCGLSPELIVTPDGFCDLRWTYRNNEKEKAVSAGLNGEEELYLKAV